MPQILFRELPNNTDELEYLNAKWVKDKSIRWTTGRNKLHAGQLVVARYCSIPYTNEIINDLRHFGCRMINNHSQIKFASDIGEWYPFLKDYTPKTYMQGEWSDIRDNGKYFVRAASGSRKWLWNTHAYAESKSDAIRIASRLMDDSYLGSEMIYIREYVPLVNVGELANGLKESVEYRFFYLGNKLICCGNYWDNENLSKNPPNDMIDYANKVADLIHREERCNFYSLDIAEVGSGGYILIEINEGQMSGLCGIAPNDFYENLWINL